MSLRTVATSRVLRCLAAVGLAAGAAAAGSYVMPGTAVAMPGIGSGSDSSIHPGVMVNSSTGQCTANFVFTSDSKVYLGAAAHCAGKGKATDTDGCKAGSAPLGTEFKIDGASRPGRLAYSSWLTMQDKDETDEDTCAYNDFALIQIDPDDVGRVSPTVPHFGGPNGLRTAGLSSGSTIYTFGNSELRQGLTPLSPKQGTALNDSGGGWTHMVSTLSPGIPGDSGSGFLDDQGRAFGILSTLSLAPVPGTNGVSDLAKALDYANENGDLGDIELRNGGRRFSAGLL